MNSFLLVRLIMAEIRFSVSAVIVMFKVMAWFNLQKGRDETRRSAITKQVV